MSLNRNLMMTALGAVSLNSCMLTKEDLLEALAQLEQVEVQVTVTPAPTPTATPMLSPELQATLDRFRVAVDGGFARQVSPTDPVLSTQFAPTSYIDGGVIYGRDDPAIRQIGARFANGINFPGRLFAFPHSITFQTTDAADFNGINRGHAAGEIAHEFILPANSSW